MLKFSQLLHKHLIGVLLIIPALQYILAIYLTKLDTTFAYRWWIFALHSVSLLSVGIVYLFESKQVIYFFFRRLTRQEIIFFLLLLSLALFVNFTAIRSYPFVSLGDEVRDAGLDAMHIVDGTIKNIFQYGRYDAHGLITPTVASFFYRIFRNSVLTYRIPSEIIATLDVLLIYLFLRTLISRFAAFFGSLTLLTFPLHLFFGRTQLNVIFNSFWTSAILLIFRALLQKQRLVDFALMGTIIGFSAGFHAAVRVIALLALCVVLLFILYKGITRYHGIWQKLKHTGIHALVLIVFGLIGFGPRIVYTTTENFFHTSRFYYNNDLEKKSLASQKELGDLYQRYGKSLMVWFYEPTSFFYTDRRPLLPPFLAIIWFLGIGYTVFVARRAFLYFPLMLVLAVPFFNSAITDWINADHRLSVLLPVGAIFIALGLFYLQGAIRSKSVKIFLFTLFGIYITFSTISYYKDQPANKDRDIKEYVAMRTIYFLQQMFPNDEKSVKQYSRKPVCLVVSSRNYYSFNLLHYKEQFDYFLPHLAAEYRQKDTLSDTEIQLLSGTCNPEGGPTRNHAIFACTGVNSYYCPLGYKGTISIYSYDSSN